MHAMATKKGKASDSAWTPPKFLVLPENRSAVIAMRRAARGVLTRRCGFSPLLLHGPPGTGKSHLAAALYAHASDKSSSVMLDASDWPRPENADSLGDMRGVDLLVVEDLQHLAQRAVNDFAVVIDQRCARRLATLVTANTGPARLANLPSRVASRLAAGLVVGTELLGSASRGKLLDELLRKRGISVRTEVIDWLSATIPGSGRQLAAAVTRLESCTAPRPLALDAVRPLFQPEATAQPPTVEGIVRLVGERFQVAARQLRGSDQHPGIVWPRQLTMHLARSLTSLSLAQIGDYFGRDHSTVRHACKKVEELLATDASLPSLLRELRAELN